ncbi:DarT ssDNA thymidine ADP-ribosyltransferase family protein [Curtobacterium sp. MCSS17_007]|uniref:DarT ssDNA thymidine ADP-ribosyltransferase family protein n=1 Tax=Curtobacterium sp. MCSS17_007 TaxID=2175646 RepID=UPI0015E8DF93|nr:DarT ssDNA thymidine ADP-ribosyltransferase family protein [Curtobacterium sp. MCSS17_007]WIE75471.1 DarT ssDNA thymidine ADP-ribosyltransferase family protein [Curtobacterium sp. MCSS17_007]
MTDECIHGFPTELCDICAPRQREAPAAPTPAPRRTRITTSLRSTPGPLGSGSSLRSPAAPELPEPRDFGALRAHHVTHVDNLAAIVAEGAVLAADAATPAVDVSAPETRAARAEATAPDGGPVSGHVAFTLSPDATRWDELRRGAQGARWSDAARRTRATEYVVLVVPVSAFGASVIVADQDAEAEDVRFAVGPEAATNLIRRTDFTDPEMHGLELLAGPRVPFSSVAVIGVPNDRVRQQVKALLAEHRGHAPRVAVFPPWFVPPVVDAE